MNNLRYKFSLKSHMLSHKDSSEVPVYSCESCPYETKRKANYHSHVLIHKDPSEIRMFECEHCEYKTRFVILFSLTLHITFQLK